MLCLITNESNDNTIKLYNKYLLQVHFIKMKKGVWFGGDIQYLNSCVSAEEI